MKRYLILWLCSFLCLVGFAQADQPVLVKEYNGKAQKTPLAQVGITVTNAGAAMSDAQGNATLRFRTLRAGDKAVVRRVEKAGYEIFNTQALEQWIISPANPFTIILCKSDRIKQLRDNYMRVSSASYDRQFKKDKAKLDALKKENKLKEEEYQQQLQDLQDEFDEQLENLENYVDQFARIDLSELGSQEMEVINLIEAGDMEKAVELYEKYDFQGQYEQQTRDIQQIDAATQRLKEEESKKREEREQVRAMISRQIATYRLAGGRENFAKIATLLKGVADADTTNVEAVFTYAEFALNQEMFEDAIQYAQVAYRNAKNDEGKVILLQTISACYEATYEFGKCEEILLQALDLSKTIYERDTEHNLDRMANARWNLGRLYLNTFELEKASEWLSLAEADYEKLYKSDSETYWDGYCVSLSDNAVNLMYAEDIEGAEAKNKLAYDILKTGLVEGDEAKETLLLRVLNTFEQIKYTQENWEEEEPYLLEDLAIHERMYKRNPAHDLPLLLGSETNVAELYVHLGQLDKAENYFNKALAHHAELTSKHPEYYTVASFCLYDVGVHLYHAKDNLELIQNYVTLSKESFDKMQPSDQEMYQDAFDAQQSLFE